MQVAIYARVSTKDQDCSMQLTSLRAYCERMGWTATEYVEHASGAAGKSRPIQDQLLKDARLRKFDAVIVWKLDRFARSSRDLLNNLDVLDNAGIRFISPEQGIDTAPGNPAGRLLLQVLGAIAEFERSLIVERVTAGVQRARKNGTRSGKPIGGRRTVFDRAEVVRLRNEGLSWRAIAGQVNQPTSSVVRAYKEMIQ